MGRRIGWSYARTVTSTVILLLAATALALLDWWAVWRRNRRLESFAKPATMAALVGVAAVVGDVPGDARAWIVVGAVFGLAGDVALLGESEGAFMAGLGAFAVGHLAYAIGAVLVGFDPVWALAGAAFVVALLSYRFFDSTVPGARSQGGSVLAAAVLFYAAVISTMTVAAWATGAWLAAAGASMFVISDWVLGHQRFVGPLPGGRLAVIVPYHVGQALLIVGLATA